MKTTLSNNTPVTPTSASSNTRACANTGAVINIDTVVVDETARGSDFVRPSRTVADASASAEQHETGALAAWGLLVGAGLGAVIGLFFRQWMTFGAAGGAIGWFAGVLMERYRR